MVEQGLVALTVAEHFDELVQEELGVHRGRRAASTSCLGVGRGTGLSALLCRCVAWS
jgi:hypothetical protein